MNILKKILLWLFGSGVTAIAVFSLFYWILLPILTRHGKETAVPDVTGVDLAIAQSILEKAGLRSQVDYRKFASSAALGEVLEQIPQPGKNVKIGKVVALQVCSGADLKQVPFLQGRPLAEAIHLLADLRLEADEPVRVYSTAVPSGRVLACNPEGGSNAREGEIVKLLVSRGSQEKEYFMPDLWGLAAGDVIEDLRITGFRVEVEPMHLPSGWRETPVRDQFPAPGSIITLSDTLTIYAEAIKE